MPLIVISKELALSGISYPKGIVLDFNKSEACIEFLKSAEAKEISIYDITKTNKFDHETIFSVNDHINCTGTNPLVGRQQKLGIDFVDMTGVYRQKRDGVITHSCGERLNKKYKFPSHYLAHFVIFSRTFKFQSIAGYLINYKQTSIKGKKIKETVVHSVIHKKD